MIFPIFLYDCMKNYYVQNNEIFILAKDIILFLRVTRIFSLDSNIFKSYIVFLFLKILPMLSIDCIHFNFHRVWRVHVFYARVLLVLLEYYWSSEKVKLVKNFE